MINIIKKELDFDDELKKKIEFIRGFCNITPTIINGNIRKIDRTNLSYIEPHRIIIKGITFLAFNYSKTIYIGNLSNKLEIKDKVSKLQEALDYFKELWKKFIKFLQDKFFSSNKYDDLIDELHEEEIIDDNLEVIQNEFSSYNSKDDNLE